MCFHQVQPSTSPHKEQTHTIPVKAQPTSSSTALNSLQLSWKFSSANAEIHALALLVVIAPNPLPYHWWGTQSNWRIDCQCIKSLIMVVYPALASRISEEKHTSPPCHEKVATTLVFNIMSPSLYVHHPQLGSPYSLRMGFLPSMCWGCFFCWLLLLKKTSKNKHEKNTNMCQTWVVQHSVATLPRCISGAKTTCWLIICQPIGQKSGWSAKSVQKYSLQWLLTSLVDICHLAHIASHHDDLSPPQFCCR